MHKMAHKDGECATARGSSFIILIFNLQKEKKNYQNIKINI